MFHGIFGKKEKEDVDSYLIAWLSRLHEEHQKWPEWKSLEEMVNQDLYRRVRLPGQGGSFLVGSKDYAGKRLVFNDSLLHSGVQGNAISTSFLPSYLSPLYDLKLVPVSRNTREMCLQPGGIASELPGERIVEMETSDPDRFEKILRFHDRDRAGIEEGMVTFQISPFGHYFFINEDLDLSAFSLRDGRFRKVAKLNNWIRYCLYFLSSGRDWYRDGYIKNQDTTYYDIQYVDGV